MHAAGAVAAVTLTAPAPAPAPAPVPSTLLVPALPTLPGVEEATEEL